MSDFYWALIVDHEADGYAHPPAVTLHNSYGEALETVADSFIEDFDHWDVAPRGDEILDDLRSHGIHAWIEQVAKP
ncbi:hypothetical protein SEA_THREERNGTARJAY_213 [Mycobacterium phage ThreeRngTarjay]|uniref:Uncharacterized protein n=1 Tax=Acinetobacter baumannii TaxID=470 RepID=A0AAJ0VL49_ACIBA|nr:hypothetical protein [Acinetobacter baumannii]ATN89021.1 hypothetical protein SEA_DMPSTRDIVER_216 [Mycobacterium phage DmpstrDiver]KZA06296.1 hypothetical protein LV35_04274 [Acinetobacter baumannii]QBI99833.1 hypothetical protein SEA_THREERNGTARJAY_213 [Mycobacterium phage ThreeRngTarjay]